MKPEQAKSILFILKKYIGYRNTRSGLVIEKFLIAPSNEEKLSQFIQIYNAKEWDEQNILEDYFKDETDFTIVGHYHLPCFDFEKIDFEEFMSDIKKGNFTAPSFS